MEPAQTQQPAVSELLETASKDSILRQINALYNLPLKSLKERYSAIFQAPHPQTNKEFLIRRIAYKLQEDAFGKLPTDAIATLETLKTKLDPIKTLGCRRTGKRALLPGTLIVKNYKGAEFSVKVLQAGFEYNGRPYKSLTRIAREISGVHQSGFVFFGL